MMPTAWRLWWCRYFGHRWTEDNRGDPVIPAFIVCVRCGKWQRIFR